MKGDRIGNRIVAIFMLFLILVPLLTMNHQKGKVSETENRVLSEFPAIFDKNGHLNEGLKSGIENWLGDNLGLRSEFVEMSTALKVKLLRQSTSDKVHFGRDGWYFYTRDHNLQLGTGEFRLTQEIMEDIAAKQQRISDWYASQGIKYILILTASKATVYPEYIATGNYEVTETPCDQLEAYLKANTTVHVVNEKPMFIENKSAGKLFLKTDTHHTQLGSYYTYQSIAQEMRNMGLTIKEFPVTFSEMEAKGEFSAMLGAKDVLGMETVPKAEWEMQTTAVKEGDVFDELTKLHQNDGGAKAYEVVMYENESAPNGTLLVYGDSQWGTVRCLPQWFGESFKSVVLTRIRSENSTVDELVKPDVVLYSCGERYIDSLLRNPVGFPQIAKELPALPQKAMITTEEYGEWIANEGVCLDSYNDERLKGSTTIQIDPNAASVKLYGWAADFCNDAPFRELYLKVGNVLLRCDVVERTSVVDHFHKESLLKTGFQVTFPAAYLKNGEVAEVSFIGVSADGQYIYEPVTYQLSYS